MDSTDHQQQSPQAHSHDKQANINIDINGESIDIDNVKNMSMDAGSRVGLTKDELMKYANQPFWVRLRNILFISFWIVWFSILVAAIGYVINSPGCTKAVSQATTARPLANTMSPTASSLFSDVVMTKQV